MALRIISVAALKYVQCCIVFAGIQGTHAQVSKVERVSQGRVVPHFQSEALRLEI